MSKAFLGARLKRLREERGLTQVAVAKQLEVSASYYNQLENNQRPLTPGLVLKAAGLFAVDAAAFSEEQEGRLVSDVREVLATSVPEESIALAEIKQVASELPAVARALVSLGRRHRQAVERIEAMARRFNDASMDLDTALPPMPYEEVRDFFYRRHNYIAVLDEFAEQIAEQAGMVGARGLRAIDALTARLQERHGVRIVRGDPEVAPGSSARAPELALRHYAMDRKVLCLAPNLTPAQEAFQVATQLAFLEASALIDQVASEGAFSTQEARALCRIGLAHHFAGALIMPYMPFLAAAEGAHYDIDRLCRQFGVGYETACHRLSTLQRPGAPGVPFFFMRVDRAGNVSKRQSATDFHFSRVGGTCPLWNVYEAFAQPGRVLVQLAQMPDGRTYLWIARTVSHGQRAFGQPEKVFSIGLGCDVRHAARLVYAQGLDLKHLELATLIGMGCKVCDRPACPQRAFPPVGRALAVDENESRFEPYAVRRER
jgi:predicted transcriptional regulator/DNA-binding XRE family transcriptional regulator